MTNDENQMNNLPEEHGPMPDEKQPEGLDNSSRSPFERPTFDRGPRFSFGPKKPRPSGDSGEGFGGRPRFNRDDRPSGGRFGGEGSGNREDRPRRFESNDNRRSGGGGGTMMPIDSDLIDLFPNPGAVNSALRAIAGIIRNQRGRGGYERQDRGDRGGFDRGNRGGFERPDRGDRGGFDRSNRGGFDRQDRGERGGRGGFDRPDRGRDGFEPRPPFNRGNRDG